MSKTIRIFTAASLLALGSSAVFAQGGGQQGPPPPMSFFITSTPKGDGANYGGIAGADAYCQQLATAAGRGNSTWHAYLSQQAKDGMPAINARDRIGDGQAHGDGRRGHVTPCAPPRGVRAPCGRRAGGGRARIAARPVRPKRIG